MDKFYKFLVPIFTIATIIVNALSALGKINNTTPQALSDSYPVFFVPAGYVFSIWGIIYIGIILYSFYQFQHSEDQDIKATQPLYIVSCLANISWIFLWHYHHPIWSVLAMLVLIVSLVAIYLRIKDGKEKTSNSRLLMVNIPFSVYLGWISVATIANITVALYVLNFNIFGIPGETWSAILILVATILGVLMILRRKDFAFALVLIWSIIGIGSKFQSIGIISLATLISIVVLIGVGFFKFLEKHGDKLVGE